MRLTLAALALLAACQGETRLLSVSLVTAPDDTVLATATHARVTLTSPRTVVEGDRTADGFALDLEVPADGGSGALYVEAFDANGDLVAVGQSPPFPVAAIEAEVAIYLAPPLSMHLAPATLSPARTDLAIAALSYGAIIAGGVDGDGVPVRDLTIYNAYTHELQLGEAMPQARTGVTLAVGTAGYAYLFGGLDAGGAPSGIAWRFDTNAAPDGEYLQLFDDPSQARRATGVAPLGIDRFFITGAPPLVISGLSGTLGVVEEPASLDGVARSIEAVPPDSTTAAIYTVIVGDGAGTTGVVRLLGADFTELAAPASALRVGHALVDLGDDTLLAVGGTVAGMPVADAIRVDPVAGTTTAIAALLATPRAGAAIARAGAYLVVAGGTDAGGTIVPTVEVFDARTLAAVGTIPLAVPRTGAVAQALTTGQVLIAGGVDDLGVPVAALELFTPPLPALD